MSFRNKYFRNLSQLIQSILIFPFHWLGILIPKSNKIWVFGNTFGYKDNPRYLYEYQLKDPSCRPIWISKERRPNGISGEWYYYLSLKGLWLQYRAGVACIGTGGGDIAKFTCVKTFIIQLWHGIPIKKLILDSPEISPFPEWFPVLNRIYYWMLKRHLKKYNLIPAVNEHNRECLSHAFGLSRDRIATTGSPRHDIILQSVKKNREKKRRLLYAPTWRSSIQEAERCVRKVLSPKCLSFFEKNELVVDVSIHPLNSKIVTSIQAIGGVNVYQGPDINIDLSTYDILITDYSSIALDFAILKRPVIFVCDDLDNYAKERGIYEYFVNIIKSNHVETEGELLVRIGQVLSSDCSALPFLYDVKADGNARKKIVDEIKSKLK